MRYKLIKTYPGSPEFGTEVEKVSNSRSSSSYYYKSGEKKYCVFNDHVEDNPEYWEKVEEENIWWVVFEQEHIQYDKVYFKAWTPYRIECIYAYWEKTRHYFNTQEEAEQYIIKNKPCLSLCDVGLILGGLERKRDIFLELKRIVKSKL